MIYQKELAFDPFLENIVREISYRNDDLLTELDKICKSTAEQRSVFDEMILSVTNDNGQMYFLETLLGVLVKLFLLNLILAMVRHRKKIALAVASTGTGFEKCGICTRHQTDFTCHSKRHKSR